MAIKIERLRMSIAVLSVAGMLAGLASPAAWAGLQQANLVDRIRVNPETHQATLVLIVDVPLEGDGATQMLERKIGFYLQYAESGRLLVDRKGVSRTAPVVFSFNQMVPPSPHVRDYLAGIKQVLEKRGYEVQFNVLDPSTKKMLRE